ncbi:hypothetical protein [Brevundimonas denitrificans]|uniref:hypothetical protein n=1 Tax=Brevundimonas denitrificans TaxID=1443434 RepID=UPI00223BCCD0|nr:hypothetical protein [Brevundimonas denitrificans]
MKSRLLHAGADEEDLMIGVNHSLTAALKMVQRTEGGRIEGECVALIESLSRPHAMQAFRYPSLLPEADLPPPDRALRTLRHFLRTTDTRLRGWWRALRPDPP